MTPADGPLLVERHEHILEVTLNRPKFRNALDAVLMDQLRALWSDTEQLSGVRCVVISGADPGFCSGADMSLLSSDRSASPRLVSDELSFLPGLQIDCPVVVAVNGVCAGGGLHFVADGDIVIASDNAKFLDPHVSAGQVSALEPISLWLRATPQALTRLALLGSAERLNAVDALRVGLVSEVVPAQQIRERTMQIAQAICTNSPAAVAATRRAMRSFEEEMLASGMQAGWDAIRAHWDHPDALEGPNAFLEKRSPQWRASGA